MKLNLSSTEKKYLQEVLSFTEAEKYIKRSKTVVATVFYEKSYKNLKKFATSLKNQTDNDFDLIILNDRINKFSTNLLNKLNFKIFKTKGTINKIRIELINYCKRMKYKNIILKIAG